MKKLFKLSSVIACISTLVACGGGGGSEHSISSPEHIQGSASKGIIAKGDVQVFKITSSGQRASSSFAQLETSESGEFSGALDISKQQLLYFEVRGRNDGTSRMYCDLASCGEVTTPELDENDNGIVDFGEWTTIDDQVYISAYAPYEGAGVPVRINLLTHMVSQSFQNGAPSISDLEDAYSQLQERLNLASLPNELAPLSTSSENPMTAKQVTDNLIIQGMMSSLTSNPDLAQAIDAVTTLYVDDPGLESDSISYADISLQAIALAERLVAIAAPDVFPASERSQVTEDLSELYEDAAESEHKLSMEDFPKLPPGLN